METQKDVELCRADEQAVLAHLQDGTPIDAATYNRLKARAEAITQRLREENGVMDIAVELIRDIRNEE